MSSTETPRPTQPEGAKNVFQSNAMWASLGTLLIGLLANVGGLEWLAQFLQANLNDIIGVVMTILGLYGAWATARRKTKLTL